MSTDMTNTSYQTTGPLRIQRRGPACRPPRLLLDLGFLTCGGSHALAPISHEAAVETGPTIEHHAAIDSAAAFHSDLDHLLTALGAIAPLDASPLTAAASTRTHLPEAPNGQGNE
ncbi:MAG TPA: hypothetical protein VFP39_02920 [Gemmatimonadales bacterium]|nr:hypothetical protein [Gemmatimonadales bacterium]